MSGTVRKALGMSLVLGVCAGMAWGQARTGHTWTTPQLRGIRRIGGDFGLYSAGLGGLESASPYGGSGLLRSNISGPASYAIPRGRAGSLAGSGLSGLAGSALPTTPRMNPNVVDLSRVRPGSIGTVYDQVDPNIIGGTSFYLQAMGHQSQALTQADKPITTFVPPDPGLFQDRVQKADKYFRTGKYLQSRGQFKIALDMARQAPEIRLSLVQANFALGHYHEAAIHLRQALKLLPELPLVRLEFQSFYGKVKDGQQEKARDFEEALEKSVEGVAEDGDTHLVKAYVCYFAGRDDEAVEALRSAYSISSRTKSAQNLQAVETFWDGMVSAGRAKGTLAATTHASASPPGAEPKAKPAPRPPDGSQGFEGGAKPPPVGDKG
jgi:hypothetical protein